MDPAWWLLATAIAATAFMQRPIHPVAVLCASVGVVNAASLPSVDTASCRAVDACMPCTALEQKTLSECMETGFKQKWLCAPNTAPPSGSTAADSAQSTNPNREADDDDDIKDATTAPGSGNSTAKREYVWRPCESQSATALSFIAFQMFNLLGMAGSGYYVHRRHQWLQYQARQRIHQRVHGSASVLTV